jgi:aldose 1-epimerase
MIAKIDERQRRKPILLKVGDAECEIWPDNGGSIARWTIAGQNMFRAANTDALTDALPTGMASFPLVPYSNRIGFGQFEWEGKNVQLELNAPPEPHSLHGTGWMAIWGVKAVSANTVVLYHDHQANHYWPWNFTAEQHITISDCGLTIKMVADNLSDQLAPLAIGHHPSFDSDGATLSFHANAVWRNGDDGLPDFAETPQNAFDFMNDAPVTGRILDNGYAGWDGKASIRWDDRLLHLDIVSNMRAAVVYIPQGKSYFCFEPVPHINNALNLPGQAPAMPSMAPGESFSAQIDFRGKAT